MIPLFFLPLLTNRSKPGAGEQTMASRQSFPSFTNEHLADSAGVNALRNSKQFQAWQASVARLERNLKRVQTKLGAEDSQDTELDAE